jgi:TolB-like protein
MTSPRHFYLIFVFNYLTLSLLTFNMASLIPGFEYDIFISYRQKDNKGDRWVSEFVEALRTELESTFKDEVSVYFDINPHDGLLETHDVDASLKEKLKCVVFIPIISRTYCDPKSFAWVHEFKAFIEQATKDQYGLKVKLPGGNVASRMLPIQIHDLDSEDKKLVESELGGFLRGVELIYKEPGVNRPLRANEDHPDNNLNKTFYRNQINKVANAINEIISGLKHPDREEKEKSEDDTGRKPLTRKNMKTKIMAGTLIILALIVAGYFIIPGLIKPVKMTEKSIAVLPFENYSDDPSQEAACLSLTDEIIRNLYKIRSIDRIATMQSVIQYKGSKENPSKIASDLKVNYLVQGNYKKYGDKVRVNVYLVDPNADKYIWEDQYDNVYSAEEVITIQSDIALKIAGGLDANLTEEENKIITKIGTRNNAAFEALQIAKSISFMTSGTNVFQLADSGMKYALKATELDPYYGEAYAYAGMFYISKAGYFGSGGNEFQKTIPEAMRYEKRALSLDPECAIAYMILGTYEMYYEYNFITADSALRKGADLEPNGYYLNYGLIDFYVKMGNYEEAINLIDNCTKKGLAVEENTIFLAMMKDSGFDASHDEIFKFQYKANINDAFIGERFFWLQEYDSALFYLNRSKTSKPDLGPLPKYQSYIAVAYFEKGRINEFESIIENLKEKSKYTLVGSADFYVAGAYSMINRKDSAFVWLEKAYQTRSPEISWLKADPLFNNLKDDPRYWDLYERCGFKAYDDYIAGLKK